LRKYWSSLDWVATEQPVNVRFLRMEKYINRCFKVGALPRRMQHVCFAIEDHGRCCNRETEDHFSMMSDACSIVKYSALIIGQKSGLRGLGKCYRQALRCNHQLELLGESKQHRHASSTTWPPCECILDSRAHGSVHVSDEAKATAPDKP
jgi:hypothetical protein